VTSAWNELEELIRAGMQRVGLYPRNIPLPRLRLVSDAGASDYFW